MTTFNPNLTYSVVYLPTGRVVGLTCGNTLRAAKAKATRAGLTQGNWSLYTLREGLPAETSGEPEQTSNVDRAPKFVATVQKIRATLSMLSIDARISPKLTARRVLNGLIVRAIVVETATEWRTQFFIGQQLMTRSELVAELQGMVATIRQNRDKQTNASPKLREFKVTARLQNRPDWACAVVAESIESATSMVMELILKNVPRSDVLELLTETVVPRQ